MSDTQQPPAVIDCIEKCPIPEGVELREVPRPRHAWGDVLSCPNADCGKCFMQVQR